MPFSPDNIIQTNSGNTAASAGVASISVTLPTGTAAGNTIVIVVGYSGTAALTTPTGFVLVASDSNRLYQFCRPLTAAGETAWTVSPTAGTMFGSWTVMELSDVDYETPVDGAANATNVPQPHTTGESAGTDVPNARDTFTLAAFVGITSAAVAPVWSNHRQELYDGFSPLDYQRNYTTVAQPSTSRGAAANNVGLSVAYYLYEVIPPGWKYITAQADFTGTATTSGCIGIYRHRISASYYPLLAGTGFEYGTVAGATLATVTAGKMADVSANAAVSTTAALSGTYGLRLTASASVAQYGWTSAGRLAEGLNRGTGILAVKVRVVSSTGLVVLARLVELTATLACELVYDTATTKLGVRIGAGTVSYQDDTLAAGDSCEVQIRFHGLRHATTRWAEWTVNGLSQPDSATATTTQGAGLTSVTLGSPSAQTCTVDYDDVRITGALGDWPVPDQKFALQRAATATIDGTATNFRTFTANGTLAAWADATALAAVDEVPPTIGASADGVAQFATASIDYMVFGMDPYIVQPYESVYGVFAYVCGWAATTTAATIALRVAFASLSARTLMAIIDPGFDNSTTTPAWVCYQWQTDANDETAWTQDLLNQAELRLGGSTDASPAIGAHAVYLEVCVSVGLPETGMVVSGGRFF